MPVAKLLVEGKLDAELLGALLPAAMARPPVVQRAGSKSSLKTICRYENPACDGTVAYLRDRDFDYEPDGATVGPCLIPGSPRGWHWKRHEIENYLLDPEMVCRVFPSVTPKAYTEELVAAAKRIRHYEAARWTVGTIRGQLPPYYEFGTRPADIRKPDFALPSSLEENECARWVTSQVTAFAAHVGKVAGPKVAKDTFAAMSRRFSEEFCLAHDQVLVWFSGKDIIVSLQSWLTAKLHCDAPRFRNIVRDWILDNPEEALSVHAEWKEFARLLSA